MRLWPTVCLFLLLLVWPGQSAGQDAAVTAPAAEGVDVRVSQESPDVLVQASRLPPSATTRTYVHVFLAFAIAFLLLWAYTVAIGRGLGRLEDEVRQLRR